MELFDLSNKTILITGGNRGIGLAITKSLHHYGARVVIAARNKQQNLIAKNSFLTAQERILTIECDVTNANDVERAFDNACEWGGELYGCIANAGCRGTGEAITTLSLDHWRQTVAVNLEGTFLTLQAGAKRLVKQKSGGRLLAISSIAALHGNAKFSDYCAAKAGITGLCRSLAIELASEQITVNCIMPGWIDTEMNKDVKADRRQYEAIRRLRIPMGRWASPEELSGAAVYLMSKASRYHTGDALVIDGGYSIF